MKYLEKFLIYLAKVFCFVIHILPEFVKMSTAWLLAILWFDIFRIRRKLAINNLLKVFPEKTKKERLSIARKSLVYMARSFLDYFSFPFLNKNNLHKHFEYQGIENLEKALQKNKGALLVSLHLGSYDFAASSLSLLFQPFYVISKTFKFALLNRVWFGLRESMQMQFISDRKSSFDILKALKKNGTVCFIIDQFMGPPIGIETNFFGIKTGSPMGLAVFSNKTRSPVIPVYTYRKGNKNYVVCCEEIPFEDLLDKDESIKHMTQVYNHWLEKVILMFPEQWMWIHNRWKVFGK